MERSLLWSAFGLGCVGWLCAALLPRQSRAEAPPGSVPPGRLFWGLAIALPILIFLLTLPAKAPFAEGQGWGRGFLIGAVAALLAGWAASAAPKGESPFTRAARVAGPMFIALPAV